MERDGLNDKSGDGQPLLSDSDLESASRPGHPTRFWGLEHLNFSICLNIILIILLLLAWGPAMYIHQRPTFDPAGYSPAHKAIENVETIFTMSFLNESSPYQGWPDDGKDRLWEDMYSMGMNIRIEESAAEKLINKTEHIAAAGFESDYRVGLEVFHQLHCLNMIRQSIYPKRYNLSIVREDGSVDFLAWSHLDHCIESIRKSLTCSADISAIPFVWHSDTGIMQPDLRSVHVCRNFTKIRDWALERYTPVLGKRARVENGAVVDYSEAGPNPERVFREKWANPAGWNKTVADL